MAAFCGHGVSPDLGWVGGVFFTTDPLQGSWRKKDFSRVGRWVFDICTGNLHRESGWGSHCRTPAHDDVETGRGTRSVSVSSWATKTFLPGRGSHCRMPAHDDVETGRGTRSVSVSSWATKTFLPGWGSHCRTPAHDDVETGRGTRSDSVSSWATKTLLPGRGSHCREKATLGFI